MRQIFFRNCHKFFRPQLLRRGICIVVFVLTVSNCFAQPWEPEIIWSRSGFGDSSGYGWTVFGLGDQNDDGFNDFGVYAYGNSIVNGDCSYVELFRGGNLPSTVPYMTWNDDYPQSRIYEADDAGDVNGDGFIDWFIYRLIPNITRQISIYLGGPSSDNQPDIVFNMDTPTTMGAIGDVNGDGFDDIFVRRENNPTRLRIYYGGVEMDTFPDWEIEAHVDSSNITWPAGRKADLNYDGYDDWVAGDPNTETIYVFLGGNPPHTIPSYTWHDLASGYIAGIVHDLNGDGFDELITQEPYVVYGRNPLQPLIDQTLIVPGGPGTSRAFSAGDVNGDGYGDLIAVSPIGGISCWGLATIHLGGRWLNPQPIYLLCGSAPPENLYAPQWAAELGDVNGDGADDVIIGGTETVPFAARRGRAIILAGDTSIHVPVGDTPLIMPDEFTLNAFPNPFNASTTIELYLPLGESGVQVSIFNVFGQQVYKRIIEAVPGMNFVRFDGTNQSGMPLPSGIYLVTARTNFESHSVKLLLLR